MTETMTGGCQCGRIRYAVEVYDDEAYLCHCRMCQRATGGVSIAFKSVKQAKVKDKIKANRPNFVELKPQENADRTVASNSELRVRIIEVSIPMALGEAELFSSLRAIVHGAV